MSFEIEWMDSRGFRDPSYEPRWISAEGFPGNWHSCKSKQMYEQCWFSEPLTAQLCARADEEWFRRHGKDVAPANAVGGDTGRRAIPVNAEFRVVA